jgi:Spy/CpxP family protein refolding chaperone
MSATRTFLLLLLLLALPGAALAQPGSDPPPDPQSDDGRADVEHRIQMMRVFALTEALELDEDTAVRLFPYLREGDAAMRELHQEKRATRKKLRKLVESGEVDDRTLDATVGKLAGLEIELTKARKTQFLGLKSILTPDQRAKFFVAQERFDREMRRRLREIRRERKGEHRERRRRRMMD